MCQLSRLIPVQGGHARCVAGMTSCSFAMLYQSKIERVLCPAIYIATLSRAAASQDSALRCAGNHED
jgi:hypothetical protein